MQANSLISILFIYVSIYESVYLSSIYTIIYLSIIIIITYLSSPGCILCLKSSNTSAILKIFKKLKETMALKMTKITQEEIDTHSK
jgi:hypothetical protein